MSFGGSGGGSGSIHASTDVALSNPADGDVLSYNGTLAKWQNTTNPSGAVTSVAGRTGAVVLAASDVSGVLAASNNLSDVASVSTTLTNLGLGNVSNTSDANKPVSTATTTALGLKENSITAGTTAHYWRGDKTFQTLNTTAVPEGTNQYFTAPRASAAAPVQTVAGKTGTVTLAASDISGALAAANNLSDVASLPTTLTNLGLNNVNNTSDANKPVSTATQTALNLKADATTVGTKALLIASAAALPAGTPAGVIVVVQS